MLPIYDVDRRRPCMSDVMSLAWTVGVLLLTHVLSARGVIVKPRTNELFLESGDQLHVVCELRHETPVVAGNFSIWSKAEKRRGLSASVADVELTYQTIDESLPDAPYTVNSEDDDDDDVLRSELFKKNVGRADSGYYRCQFGFQSSRILVTVIDIWPLKRPAVAEHVNSEVHLTCIVTDDAGWTNYSVQWYKDGKQVGDGGSSKYSVQQTPSGSVLTVRRVREYDVGPYECAVTLGTGLARKTFSEVVNLFAYPHVRSFYRSESVVAGQSLELNCRAWGWQTPNVSWYQGQQELTPDDDPRVTLSTAGDRPRGSRLTIDHVDESDRAEYTCVAWALTEELGGVLRQYNATVYVRVKGRLAALWPLLGLGVEVIVLCVIIVAYEMRRKKNALLDDVDKPAVAEDDSCAKAKMTQNSNSSTTHDRSRQRKDTN